jgi:hypothetical protein
MASQRDISELFSLIDERLEYFDGPLAGFAVSRQSGQMFAFRCITLIDACLWHWIFLPAASTGQSVDEVFASAIGDAPKEWISVIEDGREGEYRFYVAVMSGMQHPISKVHGGV